MLALLAVALALGATVAAVLLVRNGERQSVLEVREGNPVSVRRPLSHRSRALERALGRSSTSTHVRCARWRSDVLYRVPKVAGARRKSARAPFDSADVAEVRCPLCDEITKRPPANICTVASPMPTAASHAEPRAPSSQR